MDDKLKKVEDALRSACRAAQNRGWTIARNVTVDPDGEFCCAIGAFAVTAEVPPELHGEFVFFRKTMGLPGVAMDIADGFDGSDPKDSTDPEYYAIGQRLAAEFIETLKI